MKKFLIKTFRIGLAILIIGFLTIQYLVSDFYNPFEKGKLEDLKTEIANSEQLPSRFIAVYSEINPMYNTNGFLVHDSNSKSEFKMCPCFNVARSEFIEFNSRRYSYDTYITGLKLEKEFTQLECLNYLVNNYNFINATGIREASEYYFEKDLSELTVEEMQILSLSLRDSSLYNPKRNMLGIKEKLKSLKN